MAIYIYICLSVFSGVNIPSFHADMDISRGKKGEIKREMAEEQENKIWEIQKP